MNLSPAREGLWSVHGAIILLGVTALFSKWIALPALDITFVRSVFAAIVLALFLYTQRASLRLYRTRDYPLAILLGILLAAHWTTYFHAMQVSSVAVGIIALHTFPIITVFLEPLFHGEGLQRRDVIAALMVLLGIYLLVPGFALGDTTVQGVLWGVLSAFLYALRNVLQRHYFYRNSAGHALLYQAAVAALVLAPFAGAQAPAITSQQWLQLLVLGIFFTALPHTLFAHSLLRLRAKTASLIACLQVVYATVFAALLLGEVPRLVTLFGGALVVGAALYESYRVRGSG